MVAQTRTPETAAQREDRMLHRAMLKNTQAEPIQSSNIYRIWSDSTPAGTVYLTNGETCSCPWMHDHHTICSHAAYVRFLADGEPPTPARPCRHCGGSGGFSWMEGWRLERADCEHCGGTGQEPVA